MSKMYTKESYSKMVRYSEELPQDLEFEVLSRLPVDSILKFKCVCKFWQILLGSPSFIDVHLSRAAASSNADDSFLVTRDLSTETGDADPAREHEIAVSLLSRETLDVSSVLQLPQFSKSTVGVTGSCNGVVCFYCKNGGFALLNPATKQSKTLPLPPNISYIPKNAFHSNHIFGFDARSNDYKIVVLATIDYCISSHEFVHEIHIYSLRCGSWREISVSLPAGLPFRIWQNGNINGVYHFVGYTCNRKEMILTFDIHDEVFGKMKHPIEGSSSSNASVLNGSLAIIDERSCGFGLRSMDVWVMKEYGVDKSWTKKYTIGAIEAEPLYFWSHNKLLLQSLSSDEDQTVNESTELMSYDLATQEIKKHQVRGARHTMRCFQYFPSLVNLM